MVVAKTTANLDIRQTTDLKRLSNFKPELVEILSTREIEIVALLSERMRDKEIAARLFISPATVKTHLRNIYGKLEAHDRRQAVNRAIEVGILKTPG